MKREIEERVRTGSFLDAHRELLLEHDQSCPYQAEESRLAKLIVPLLLESLKRAEKVNLKFDRQKMERLQHALKHKLNTAFIKAGASKEERDAVNTVLSPLNHALDIFDPDNDRTARIIFALALIGMDNLGQVLAYTDGDILETQPDGSNISIIDSVFGPAVTGRMPKRGTDATGTSSP